VIDPGSIPKRSGNRVKADQRDARKLTEYFACGLLTERFIPDREFESARGMVHSRTGLIQNLRRSKIGNKLGTMQQTHAHIAHEWNLVSHTRSSRELLYNSPWNRED
jgi:hypothetical protein